ncbi:MAG: melibiose:sodium transporter MelB [Clostridium sp.]|uniref:melibiose:sodium transporter MelB n=1 Tax=Clostridium sp. TaxID=1506 RepID=UPI003F2FA4AC
MDNLSSTGKFSYGIGALGKDLACGIVYSYLMFYFTDVVGLSPVFVGSLFLVARLWDSINDPIMGMIVDNTRSKWGKFRPWILIGTLVNAVILVLLFTKPNLEGTPLYVYFAVVYILWGMTYTIMDIPFWSMIPALSRSKEEREKIAVIPRIFASLGGLLIGSLGLVMVSKLGSGDQLKGYSKFAIIIAVLFIISSLVTVINVKDNSASSKNKEKINIKQMINILKNNDQLLVFIGIVLAMNLFSQLIGGMALYYFTYVVGNENMFSVFIAFSGIAEMSALALFPLFARKIGRKTVFKFACVLEVSGLLLLLAAGLFAPQNTLFIIISSIILKLGSGLVLGASTVMLADIVDYGEYKLGSRNESIIFSAQTLLVKSASAVSGWLIGIGLATVGYVPGVAQSSSTIFGMRVLMIGIPIIAVILMYTIYKTKYKINGEFHDTILDNLNTGLEAS